MSAHPHAELMLLYAQDAAVTDKPWELWQWKSPVTGEGWNDISAPFVFYEEVKYRRKPKLLECVAFVLTDDRTVFEKDRRGLFVGDCWDSPNQFREGAYIKRIVDMREVVE